MPISLPFRLPLAAGFILSLGLSACGGGRGGPVPAPDKAATFELVEADLAHVHRALAGELPLADGSRLSCVKLAELYIERIFAYNDHPQPRGGLPIRGALAISPQALDQAVALDALYARDGGVV